MKLFKNRAILTCFFAVAVFALFTSCMPEPADPESKLVIGVKLNDIDSTLTAGSDSLKISKVRMIHGESYFTISQDSTIRLTYARQLTYTANMTTPVVLIYPPRGSSAFFPEGSYQGLTFEIARAESISETEPVYDPDPVFTDGGNYSIIVNGMYHGEEFTFKAAENFSYSFDGFPFPVTVTSQAKVYRFRISTNLESWFINSQRDGFLNPADGKEKELIYKNIKKSFTIEQLSPQ